MTKDELLKKLRELQTVGDPEIAHGPADQLLLDYIADPEISEEYGKIEKWYS
jgi:hypothetical protein